MEFKEKAGQSLIEPVTAAEFKTYIGYTGTDQDALIATMITAVRRWVERYSGMCAVEKIYQVHFNRYDLDPDGRLAFPIGPVKSITSVYMNTTEVSTDSYSTEGYTETKLYIYGGIGNYPIYVEYVADKSDCLENLKLAILRLATNLFKNKRDVSDMTMQKVDFTTKQLLNSL